MKAWIARDKNGELWLYSQKPIKIRDQWYTLSGDVNRIETFKFQQVQWEDKEPTEVEFEIKIKEAQDD